MYEKVYGARGECPENRINEQQLDLFAVRTSTGKMWSNQLRLDFSCRHARRIRLANGLAARYVKFLQ